MRGARNIPNETVGTRRIYVRLTQRFEWRDAGIPAELERKGNSASRYNPMTVKRLEYAAVVPIVPPAAAGNPAVPSAFRCSRIRHAVSVRPTPC